MDARIEILQETTAQLEGESGRKHQDFLGVGLFHAGNHYRHTYTYTVNALPKAMATSTEA